MANLGVNILLGEVTSPKIDFSYRHDSFGMIGNFLRGIEGLSRLDSAEHFRDIYGNFQLKPNTALNNDKTDNEFVEKIFQLSRERPLAYIENYVAPDARESTSNFQLNNGISNRDIAFILKSGYKGNSDKSSYGNKISYDLSLSLDNGINISIGDFNHTNNKIAIAPENLENFKDGDFITVNYDGAKNNFNNVNEANHLTSNYSVVRIKEVDRENNTIELDFTNSDEHLSLKNILNSGVYRFDVINGGTGYSTGQVVREVSTSTDLGTVVDTGGVITSINIANMSGLHSSSSTFTIAGSGTGAQLEARFIDALNGSFTIQKVLVNINTFLNDRRGIPQRKETFQGAYNINPNSDFISLLNHSQYGSIYIHATPLETDNIIGVDGSILQDAIGTGTLFDYNIFLPEGTISNNKYSIKSLSGGSDGTAPDKSDYSNLLNSFEEDYRFNYFTINVNGQSHDLIPYEEIKAKFSGNKLKSAIALSPPNLFRNPILEENYNVIRNELRLFKSKVQDTISSVIITSDKFFECTRENGSTYILPPTPYDISRAFNVYNSTIGIGGLKNPEVSSGGYNHPLSYPDVVIDNGLRHNTDFGTEVVKEFRINISEPIGGNLIIKNTTRTMSSDFGYFLENQISQYLDTSHNFYYMLKKTEQTNADYLNLEIIKDQLEAYLLTKWNNGEFFKGRNIEGVEYGFRDIVKVSIEKTRAEDIRDAIAKISISVVIKTVFETINVDFGSLPITNL